MFTFKNFYWIPFFILSVASLFSEKMSLAMRVTAIELFE